MTNKWDNIFLGKLSSNGRINFNVNNSALRFPIELISTPPSDFPTEEEKKIIGFSNDLYDFGFNQDSSLGEEEVKEELKSFLEDRLITFKIKIRTGEHDRVFYNATDIQVVKSNTIDQNRFFPVPILKNLDSENQLRSLANNSYVKNVFGFSTNEEDYPGLVIVEEIKKDAGLVNENRFFAFGPITDMQYSEEYGYKFITESNQTHYIELEKSDLERLYTRDKISFVETNHEEEIRSRLVKQGKNIEVSDIKPIEEEDEEKFLDIFNKVALSNELSYEPSDLINFHTAMKSEGLVILSGMSGTGKSKLVQCYYEAINQFAGAVQKSLGTAELLFIPVSPSWQDDTDLLGYLDSLSGLYRPGSSGLVDFLIKAESNPQECYIVCLDEMNLAKVEHYFSQFISVLERDVDNRYLNLYNSNLYGRIHNEHQYKSKIKIGNNVFFVGTVNMDESTHHFSDKMFDRSNVIVLKQVSFKEMSLRLKQFKDELKDVKTSKKIMDDELRTYTKYKAMKKEGSITTLKDQELELLWKLNEEMKKANHEIGIGYRIINQIGDYLNNLPSNTIVNRNSAFDLQVLQRVLTKLKGPETLLVNLVGHYNGEEYVEGTLYNLLNISEDISVFIESKDRLKKLAKELSVYGHTI